MFASTPIVLLALAGAGVHESPAPSALFLVRVAPAGEQDSDATFALDRSLTPGPPAAAEGGGEGGEPGALVERIPWPAEDMEWMFLRAEGHQTNWDVVRPADDSPDRVSLEVTSAGAGMAGLDLKPRIEQVDAASLAAFLLARGNRIDDGSTVLPQSGLFAIHREESAKTLFHDQGISAAPGAMAMSKSGQRAEIKPLIDPSLAASDCCVEIMIDARRIDRLRVLATPVAGGPPRVAETNLDGVCNFGPLPAGAWRFEIHVCQPTTNDGHPRAEPPDWELLSATLTCVRGEPR